MLRETSTVKMQSILTAISLNTSSRDWLITIIAIHRMIQAGHSKVTLKKPGQRGNINSNEIRRPARNTYKTVIIR